MKRETDEIISQLKEQLERHDSNENYSQWILGISINDHRKQCVVARVVIKTNESPYVDGMDILFDRMDDQLTMDSKYYENSPDFMGGTVEDSFKWLQRQGDLIYQQMDDPFENDCLMVEQNRSQE